MSTSCPNWNYLCQLIGDNHFAVVATIDHRRGEHCFKALRRKDVLDLNDQPPVGMFLPIEAVRIVKKLKPSDVSRYHVMLHITVYCKMSCYCSVCA